LMIEVLRHYDGAAYRLHAYVVMPDHLHALLTPAEAIEKSMQLIKGGFSFRAKRELGWNWEVWQLGFTDHRIRDGEDWERHLKYIRLNPVEARLVEDSALYEWMGFPCKEFPQGLKPSSVETANVRAEARTLHPSPATVEHMHAAAKAAPFQGNDQAVLQGNNDAASSLK